MQKSYQYLIKLPALIEDQASLTAMEKGLLGHFILLARPRFVVELGVFRAVTTQFICEFLHQNDIDAKVVGFDLPEVVTEIIASNSSIRHWQESTGLELVPGWLPESLMKWLQKLNDPIDFALVDARHDYRSVMGELSLLWPRLSLSGYILCHDYSSKHEGVRYAVDHFAASHNAMVLPLTSCVRAREAGHGSVLVALCHRRYKLDYAGLIHYLWLKTKVDLLSNSLLNKAWHHWARPLVRKNGK